MRRGRAATLAAPSPTPAQPPRTPPPPALSSPLLPSVLLTWLLASLPLLSSPCPPVFMFLPYFYFVSSVLLEQAQGLDGRPARCFVRGCDARVVTLVFSPSARAGADVNPGSSPTCRLCRVHWSSEQHVSRLEHRTGRGGAGGIDLSLAGPGARKAPPCEQSIYRRTPRQYVTFVDIISEPAPAASFTSWLASESGGILFGLYWPRAPSPAYHWAAGLRAVPGQPGRSAECYVDSRTQSNGHQHQLILVGL